MSEGRQTNLAKSVGRQSPDRYFASLFAPPETRDAFLLLNAYDLRLGQIEARGEDVYPALIRLAWWRDQLAALAAGEVRGEPLLADIRRRIPAAHYKYWSALAEAHMDRVEGMDGGTVWPALRAAAQPLLGEKTAARIVGAAALASRNAHRSPTRRQWMMTWHILTGRGA
ncbi:squalene/phytoene synthase family protein [Pacificimonas sp. WHA3]|uniref:Squalene/phytoene synthase family protein n=1 Tax=Pacificimonas pallii TaxID=2827236 RepID=A0ABS6SE88_9SPHN|nr:squalene/phytoene synthase family protein [Pacificimonas pallii]MBV7256733.1 squalene/phytoene synthase family protein [Pacificimonas pallii]